MISGLMAYVFITFLGNEDIMMTLLVWGLSVTVLLSAMQVYKDVTGSD